MQLGKGHIAFAVACFVAGIVFGASFRSCSGTGKPEGKTLLVHDTIRVSDTVRIKEQTKPLYVIKRDTIWKEVPVGVTESADSLCDGRVTVPIEIPIMQYAYRDTFETDSSRIELGITYEGYKAKIDTIDLQYRFNVKPRTIEKKKGWGQFVGIGIGAGYGASVVGNRVYAAPEVGVYITYGFGYTWRK